jgi:ribosomal protein S18 acetylase RimI-like enzyme
MTPAPPALPGHTWRPLRPGDGPALAALARAAQNPADNIPPVDYAGRLARAADELADSTCCASTPDGAISAYAWLALDQSMRHERRAFFEGAVDPALYGRGLGDFLIDWQEARARRMLGSAADPRPAVMRIDVYHQNPSAVEIYRRHGFALALVEDELRRDLDLPIPALPLPTGVALLPWSDARASLFYAAYLDAFRERPGFPGWDEPTWRANLTDHTDFWPAYSLLLLDGAEPAGFAICAADEQEAGAGHIVQMGLRPAWRGRGLADMLLAQLLQRFRAAGLRQARLEVNTNNPRAARLYARLGFVLARRFSSYRKALDPASG